VLHTCVSTHLWHSSIGQRPEFSSLPLPRVVASAAGGRRIKRRGTCISSGSATSSATTRPLLKLKKFFSVPARPLDSRFVLPLRFNRASHAGRAGHTLPEYLPSLCGGILLFLCLKDRPVPRRTSGRSQSNGLSRLPPPPKPKVQARVADDHQQKNRQHNTDCIFSVYLVLSARINL
jgi:hypothetical protein